MSHSRSHKKNPSPSSNRQADDKIPPSSSKPYFGGKTWDTITKSEFLKIKESMTPEERQALKDFTNPAKLANFDPDWVPPEIPDLPTGRETDLPAIDDLIRNSAPPLIKDAPKNLTLQRRNTKNPSRKVARNRHPPTAPYGCPKEKTWARCPPPSAGRSPKSSSPFTRSSSRRPTPPWKNPSASPSSTASG
jgi:hypothetical protein